MKAIGAGCVLDRIGAGGGCCWVLMDGSCRVIGNAEMVGRARVIGCWTTSAGLVIGAGLVKRFCAEFCRWRVLVSEAGGAADELVNALSDDVDEYNAAIGVL